MSVGFKWSNVLLEVGKIIDMKNTISYFLQVPENWKGLTAETGLERNVVVFQK